MDAIQKIKHIAATQKSVSTSRLSPLIKHAETMYIQQGKKLQTQAQELNVLRKRLERMR